MIQLILSKITYKHYLTEMYSAQKIIFTPNKSFLLYI